MTKTLDSYRWLRDRTDCIISSSPGLRFPRNLAAVPIHALLSNRAHTLTYIFGVFPFSWVKMVLLTEESES